MRPNNDPDFLSQSLAEPSRRALLENLRFGQKTVTQLVEATQLKQPNVSNHLAKMRQQGIVRAERIGRQVYYSLSMPFTDILMRMHEFAANPDAEGTAALHPPTDAQGTPASGADAAFAPPSPVTEPLRQAPVTSGGGETSSPDASGLVKWRKAYFNAVMTGNEEQAVLVVNALLKQRQPMETIYAEVFARSINHIGELFQQGETDEAHEHMASAITERMMARVALFYTPVARTSCRALLGCVAGNWHVLGLRMLSDSLKGLGWETIFLGANVTTASFVAMAKGTRPDLVIVSCSMEEQSTEAHALLTALNALRGGEGKLVFQLAAGGHYFLIHADELRHLPVDFTANDLHQFLEEVKARFAVNCI